MLKKINELLVIAFTPNFTLLKPNAPLQNNLIYKHYQIQFKKKRNSPSRSESDYTAHIYDSP